MEDLLCAQVGGLGHGVVHGLVGKVGVMVTSVGMGMGDVVHLDGGGVG